MPRRIDHDRDRTWVKYSINRDNILNLSFTPLGFWMKPYSLKLIYEIIDQISSNIYSAFMIIILKSWIRHSPKIIRDWPGLYIDYCSVGRRHTSVASLMFCGDLSACVHSTVQTNKKFHFMIIRCPKQNTKSLFE